MYPAYSPETAYTYIMVGSVLLEVWFNGYGTQTICLTTNMLTIVKTQDSQLNNIHRILNNT